MQILIIILTAIVFFQPVAITIVIVLMQLYAFYFKHKNAFYFVLALPFLCLKKITHNGISRWTIWKVGLIPSHFIRNLSYKMMGVDMKKNVIIYFRAEIRSPHKLSIGRGSIIGDNALLDARKGLRIGSNVNLSSNVSIYSLQHNYRSLDFNCDFDRPLDVTIGDRAWLGCNVTVLPGVRIGTGAIVCAGAVVTKDIEDYGVYAGIPAKKIGERPHNIEYIFNGKGSWFY